MSPAAAATPSPKPAAAAVPPIPYSVGSVVTVKHPGFAELIRGKVIRHCNAENMMVESPNGFRLYTHHKNVLKHTPDLLGDVYSTLQAKADRDASEHAADEASEDEPSIITEWYISILNAWCKHHHD